MEEEPNVSEALGLGVARVVARSREVGRGLELGSAIRVIER